MAQKPQTYSIQTQSVPSGYADGSRITTYQVIGSNGKVHSTHNDYETAAIHRDLINGLTQGK